MTGNWMRISLLLAAVCLTLAAAAPNASAACLSIFQCTTEGETMYFQDTGCCNITTPTIRNRLYVCHNGCYQRTNTTMCTIDPCV